MRRALVTGATGLVGSHVVERLAMEGWAVRGLVRDPEGARWLESLGAELVTGDVRRPHSLRAAVASCDVVFHAAALVSATADWTHFDDVNVDGTRHVIGAAAAAGARMVHVSSVAVYGASARYRGRPTVEDDSPPVLSPTALYARSKRDSERLVLEAHAVGALWATVIRPDVIYGRRDRQFIPRVARAMRFGVLPLPGPGTAILAIVHAANVADGAVRAARCDGAGGRAYNLTNDGDVTVADFVRLGAQGLGRRVRVASVPMTIARATAGAARLVTRAFRPSAADHIASTFAFLTRNNPFSSMRAVTELGWTPTVAPHDGIVDAFRDWAERRRKA